MNGEPTLPETIRVEVKFTTTTSITVPSRELEALRATDAGTTGLIAVLFWCNDRRVDGRWLTVDVRERLGPTSPRGQRWSKEDLARTTAHQPRLAAVQAHLDQWWKPFLRAFLDEAMTGREALHEELARCHADGTMEARLPGHAVLDAEHRGALADLIGHHGESTAGQVLQELFAYLLAHAGYRTVTINPIGVPDIVMSDLRPDAAARRRVQLGTFDPTEVRKLVQYCQKAGDARLAERLLGCLEQRSVTRRAR
jgi:hypothetical protein